MKTYYCLSVVALGLALSSCSDKSSMAGQNGSDLITSDTLSLSANDPVFAQRDSLIALFNDISGDLIQIKQIESIVSIPGNLSGENGKSSPQLRDDLMSIRQALEERRQKLAELEKKLNASAGKNAQLSKMIENLKTQLSQNEETIASLTEQLTQANSTIAGLNVMVDSLNTSVANVSAEKMAVEQQNQNLTNEMNRCFYAIGSKSELKDHKIIETGFLRKTKIMQGDYEASYFTTADRRALTSIPLYAKKAKVLTNQPSDSYSFTTEANGNKVLNITNSSKFWSTSNYLVIQTD